LSEKEDRDIGGPSDKEVRKFVGWVDGRDEPVRVFVDDETEILAAVYERLRRLDPAAQDRILSYMRDRLAWDNRSFAQKP
jgi:hypothetical protein